MQCPLLFEEEWVDPRRRRRRRRRRCCGWRRRREWWRRVCPGAYPRGSTLARDMHTPALRMGVLRVDKAAKRRVLAAHAGCALPKGRRTRRRRTRIECAHALLAIATGFHCVRRVTIIRHVPLAPRLALAAIAVICVQCCIGNVSQGVVVLGRADFSWGALAASAAGLLCRFALAIICDLIFAPRLTSSGSGHRACARDRGGLSRRYYRIPRYYEYCTLTRGVRVGFGDYYPTPTRGSNLHTQRLRDA